MKRQPLVTPQGIQYLRYDPVSTSPIGVVLWLGGDGQKGSDINILDQIEIPKMLDAGLEVPYVVICGLLPANQGGWYENDVNPLIQVCIGLNLGKPHLTGLSLGGMRLFTMLIENPGVFGSVAPVCGKVDFTDSVSLNKLYTELNNIPCICWYDPNDSTIYDGYSSIKRLYDQLNGKTDIQLVLLKGSPTAHVIWPQAYVQYWTWLASKVSPPVRTPTIWINGIDTGIQPPQTSMEIK